MTQAGADKDGRSPSIIRETRSSSGYWFAPEREALQALIDRTQQTVTGEVRLSLYKGNVLVTGRRSESHSLFDAAISTFEDDRGKYDQKDAAGFIKLNALRLKLGKR